MNPAGGMLAQAMSTDVATVSIAASLQALGNSAALGVLLMILTVWVGALTGNVKGATSEKPLSPSDLIAGSANVLFICFGMTGMLLLVNNNIARAFAIAAAIALVRFKIKVDSKVMSMSLFYAVLTGMACGVGHAFIGYVLVLFFGLLQFAVIIAVKFATKRYPTPAPVPAPAALTSNAPATASPTFSDSLATVK